MYEINLKLSNDNTLPEERSSGSLINIGLNEFLLIGGSNREKIFNDIWFLEILKENEKFYHVWTKVKNDSEYDFQARFGHLCIFNDKGKENFEILCYGGQNYFEGKHYADTLSLQFTRKLEDDSTTHTPILKSIKNFIIYPLDPEKNPRERNSHGGVLNDNKFYVFGGGNGEGLNSDLWYFELNNKNWMKCNLTEESITSREMHGVTIYTNKKNETHLYVLGGRLYEEIDDKIYRINTNNYNCEFVCKLPSRMCSFAYASFKHFIILYGGTDGVEFLNDLMIFNINSQQWAKSKIKINFNLINYDPNLISFVGRIGSMMSIDYRSERLVIFGGSSLHKDNNFTFFVSLQDLLNEDNITPININI